MKKLIYCLVYISVADPELVFLGDPNPDSVLLKKMYLFYGSLVHKQTPSTCYH